jgi:hypothetical protein
LGDVGLDVLEGGGGRDGSRGKLAYYLTIPHDFPDFFFQMLFISVSSYFHCSLAGRKSILGRFILYYPFQIIADYTFC